MRGSTSRKSDAPSTPGRGFKTRAWIHENTAVLTPMPIPSETITTAATIGIRPIASTIAPPTGWTLIGRQDNAVVQANSLALYWKAADAADIAATNFTFALGGGFAHSSGGIQAVPGIDTRTPYDVVVGNNTPSGTSHTTGTITPTVANSMIVAAFSYASASS